MSLKCACGNQTNEKDGTCRVCKLFGITLRQAQGDNCHGEPVEPKGGKDMSATGIKKCEHCGNDYKPTSNAQKYCANCKKEINLEKTKIRKRNKIATPADRSTSHKDNNGKKKILLKVNHPVPVIASEEKHRSTELTTKSQFIDVIKDGLRNELGPVIENIKNELKKLEGMIN